MPVDRQGAAGPVRRTHPFPTGRRRYSGTPWCTAELAEELRRFATSEMVRAHTYSVWQLLRRLAGRYRALVAAAGVAVVLLGAYTLRVVADRDVARRRVAESHLEQGRQALLGGDRLRSLGYLSAALGEEMGGPGTRFMLRSAGQAVDWQLAVLDGHAGEVFALALDDAHGRVATGGNDALVNIWEPTGALRSALRGHTGPVRSATFSHDGAPSQISALAQTADGYPWIGSSRGLFRLDGLRFELYEPPPGVSLPSYNIFTLMATRPKR